MAARHKVPFILASTAHGPIIFNHLDWKRAPGDTIEIGVGLDLLMHGEFDLALISFTLGALELRHRERGPAVVALDCGANIGIYTIEWARMMADWGMVLAFEPQERMFYALAGNLALNNLFNARALNKAVGNVCAIADMPSPDYTMPGQYGGLALNGKANIGQTITATAPVEVVTIDSLQLKRVDFIKLDIEGMEAAALSGARATIERERPFMLVEWHICGFEPIEAFLKSVGYDYVKLGMNVFCGPAGNEIVPRVREIEKMKASAA